MCLQHVDVPRPGIKLANSRKSGCCSDKARSLAHHTTRELQKKNFFFFFCFLEPHPCGLWKFPVYGSNQTRSHQSSPQQHQIWAESATYTTVHGKSLTHWARPGIKPASSWLLVRFVTAEPQGELQKNDFLTFIHRSKKYFNCFKPSKS